MTRPIVNYYDKATYFTYDEMVEAGQQAFYCLSPSTILLAYNLVKFYGGWRGRYVENTGVDVMHGLTDDEWTSIEDLYQLALFELKESVMSGDDIRIGMQAIADAIRDSACCNNAGGDGSGGAGSEPTDPTVDIDDGSTPPSSWSGDYASYLTYKCDYANYVVDQMIEALEDMKGFNWIQLGVLSTGAAVTAVLVAIGVAIPATLAFVAIGALLGYTGSVVTLLQTLIDAVTDHRSDIVCSLYSSGDVGSAELDFKQALDDAIADEVPDDTLQYILGLLSDMFVTTDLLNGLFTQNVTLSIPVGSSDCSSCNVTTGLFFNFLSGGGGERGSGSLVGDGSLRTLNSTFDPTAGFHYISFGVYSSDDVARNSYSSSCSPLPAGVSGTAEESFTFRMETLTRNPNNGTLGTVCNSGVHGLAWNDNIVLGQDYQNTWLELISSNPFSFTCRITYP